MDIAAAYYVHNEELKREIEREKRDREFWIRAFGGEVPEEEPIELSSDTNVKSTDVPKIAREPQGYPVIKHG